MLAFIATLSGLCLLLVAVAWENTYITNTPGTCGACSYREDWDTPTAYESDGFDEVLGCCEEVGCDCGNLFFPCPLCPGAVDLRRAGLIRRVTYRTLKAIKIMTRDLGGLSLGNYVSLAILLSNGSLLVCRRTWKWGKSTRSIGCQKNCDDYTALKESKRKHRYELEQMAKAIEFLQKKYRRQTKMFEKSELSADLFNSDVRNFYRSYQPPPRSTRRSNSFGFEVQPENQDLEWY